VSWDRLAAGGTWVAWGLALQTIGVGIPVTIALRRANRDGVLGRVTHYTVRLVWHEMLRADADVGLMLLGLVVFLVGAVVMARPFVRRRAALFVAVRPRPRRAWRCWESSCWSARL
jgi:hypothetical protein